MSLCFLVHRDIIAASCEKPIGWVWRFFPTVKSTWRHAEVETNCEQLQSNRTPRSKKNNNNNKNCLSQNAAGFVCKEDSTGTGLAEAEEDRGERRRGHSQKELADAQCWEPAIHSLSTAPLLSSLLSFTLPIMIKYSAEGEKKEVEIGSCASCLLKDKITGWVKPRSLQYSLTGTSRKYVDCTLKSDRWAQKWYKAAGTTSEGA